MEQWLFQVEGNNTGDITWYFLTGSTSIQTLFRNILTITFKMFSRPYTTLSRITIEAADCQMNFKNIHGHLTITVEPLDPVFPTGNRDPLLAQTSRQKTVHITTNNDNTAIEKDNPQPQLQQYNTIPWLLIALIDLHKSLLHI